MENKERHKTARVLIGLILVALGVALVAGNIGWLGDFSIWRYWPAAILAIGLYKLANSESHKERLSGFWFVFLGLWLLVSILHWFDLSFKDTWPAVIVAAGISSVWSAIHDSKKQIATAKVTQ